MRKHTLLLLLLAISFSALFSQNSARRGQDYAYFFYVTQFADPGWTKLPETAEECHLIGEELQAQYGFRPEYFPNLTKTEMRRKIRELNARRYGPDDQVLFFFSTHGQFQPASDRGYLIPADGKYRDDGYGDTWLSYDDLGSDITLNPAEHVLLALDACYSGAFGDKWKGQPTTDPRYETATDCISQAATALEFDSRIFFTSGGRDQRTPARSLFARRWLEFLMQGRSRGVLTTYDLRYYLGSIPDPTPEGGTFTSRHMGGKFVFVPLRACVSSGTGATSADATHWHAVAGRRDAALEHLQRFPGCPHYQQALSLVAQPAAMPNSAANPSPVTSNSATNPGPVTPRSITNPGSVTPNSADAREPRNPGAPYVLNELPYMVFVSGGTFQMGSNNGGSDEKPVHSVTLSDFRLARYEVTVGEYLAFAEATKKNYPDWLERGNPYHIETGSNDYYKKRGYTRSSSNLPIVGVSWYDAVAYCNWLSDRHGYRPVYRINGETVTADWTANGYRLPTEAEWEYAARDRGGDKTWAGTASENGLRAYANYSGTQDDYEYTAPVGKLRPNDLGLHDMSGNVWEWCWDWYGAYGTGTTRDPKGAGTGSSRVHRGGGWISSAASCRTAFRYGWYPGDRDGFVGFRLARSE